MITNDIFIKDDEYFYLPYGYVNKFSKNGKTYVSKIMYDILKINDFSIYHLGVKNDTFTILDSNSPGFPFEIDNTMNNILLCDHGVLGRYNISCFRLTTNEVAKIKLLMEVKHVL